MKVLQEPKRHVASRRARPPPFLGASIFVKFTYRKVNKNEGPPPFWKHVKKIEVKGRKSTVNYFACQDSLDHFDSPSTLSKRMLRAFHNKVA